MAYHEGEFKRQRVRISPGIERTDRADNTYSYRGIFNGKSKSFETMEEAVDWRNLQKDALSNTSSLPPVKEPDPITKYQEIRRKAEEKSKDKDARKLSNGQLDAAVASFLWEAHQTLRDKRLYNTSKRALRMNEFITPKVLADAFGVSQQRCHASLLRLQDIGCARCTVKFDYGVSRDINTWHINEHSLVRYLLAEIQKEKIHEKNLPF